MAIKWDTRTSFFGQNASCDIQTTHHFHFAASKITDQMAKMPDQVAKQFSQQHFLGTAFFHRNSVFL